MINPNSTIASKDFQLWQVRGSELTAEHLQQILALRARVFVVEQDCVYLDIDGQDLLSTTEHFFLLGDSEAVACLRVLTAGEPQGFARIGRVCTAPASRGQGLGDVIMKAAVAAYSEQPQYLEAQTHAEKFYQRFGFSATSEEFLEGSIPHRKMERIAPSS